MKKLWITLVILILVIISITLSIRDNGDTYLFDAIYVSDHWFAIVTYTTEDDIIWESGDMHFEGEKMPSKFTYYYSHPSGIYSEENTVTVHNQHFKRCFFGKSLFYRKENDLTVLKNSLKQKVSKAYIKVIWEQDGKRIEENIKFSNFQYKGKGRETVIMHKID